GRLGPDARPAIPVLTETLGSLDLALRLDAALSLAAVAADAKDVLPVLLEVVQEKNHPYRIRALAALGKVRVPNETAVSALVRTLWDEGPGRTMAAEVLGQLGSAAKAAVPTLQELLRVADPDS